MEEILADTSQASDAERHLASFTALDRDEWADFREKYTSTGVNKHLMDMIDTAAFFLVLETETRHYGNVSQIVRELSIIRIPICLCN